MPTGTPRSAQQTRISHHVSITIKLKSQTFATALFAALISVEPILRRRRTNTATSGLDAVFLYDDGTVRTEEDNGVMDS